MRSSGSSVGASKSINGLSNSTKQRSRNRRELKTHVHAETDSDDDATRYDKTDDNIMPRYEEQQNHTEFQATMSKMLRHQKFAVQIWANSLARKRLSRAARNGRGATLGNAMLKTCVTGFSSGQKLMCESVSWVT
jgi:hypothetical protein